MALKDSIGRGVKPPVFRGDKGERPEAHILRAEDWMEASKPWDDRCNESKKF